MRGVGKPFCGTCVLPITFCDLFQGGAVAFAEGGEGVQAAVQAAAEPTDPQDGLADAEYGGHPFATAGLHGQQHATFQSLLPLMLRIA